MRMHLPSIEVTLESAVPFSMVFATGTEIRVAAGNVWLTEESVAEDMFLGAGSSYFLQTPGRVVVESAGPARVVVATPVSVSSRSGASAFAERIGLAFWRARKNPARVGLIGVAAQ